MITRKKELIQSYENIQNYIKPSLTEDTFIVFTTYDVKFNHIEALVPGMSVLTVVKNETGELFVSISPNNESLNDYIKKVAESEAMKEIIEEVNLKLSEAIEKDTSLRKLVEYLKDIT